VFVYYTGVTVDKKGSDMDCHVLEFHRDASGDGTDPLPKPILDIPHPDINHNGGNLLFDPDGMLYIGTGDGGRALHNHGDARLKNTRLAKILRIDVDHGSPDTAPPDNPFFNDDVADDPTDAHKDIWLWGLRNPFRWSFDRQTKDLWIADVGQACWEEI